MSSHRGRDDRCSIATAIFCTARASRTSASSQPHQLAGNRRLEQNQLFLIMDFSSGCCVTNFTVLPLVFIPGQVVSIIHLLFILVITAWNDAAPSYSAAAALHYHSPRPSISIYRALSFILNFFGKSIYPPNYRAHNKVRVEWNFQQNTVGARSNWTVDRLLPTVCFILVEMQP